MNLQGVASSTYSTWVGLVRKSLDDAQHVVHITVKGAKGKEEIKSTRFHPFMVPGKGWMDARDLTRGEKLLTPEGKIVTVENVCIEPIWGPPVRTDNPEVENSHTYFVGKQGVWVHNAWYIDWHPEGPQYRISFIRSEFLDQLGHGV